MDGGQLHPDHKYAAVVLMIGGDGGDDAGQHT